MSLRFCNRQAVRPVQIPLLRKIVGHLCQKLIAAKTWDLGIYLVDREEMTRINETFLRHTGSTDVVTFDYADAAHHGRNGSRSLHGEIFICLDDAVDQARQFRTTWEAELVRYCVHGVLHLLGHDDLDPASRRKMKRVEGQWVKKLSDEFDLQKVGRPLPRRRRSRRISSPPPTR
jgi:rRNA maturation RNase YbeY